MTTEERLNAEKQAIAEVFSTDKFYVIPPFQRRFVWERENFQQLIEDLWEAFKAKKDYYFLGSIVLSRKDTNTYYVIDGQQRLMTLSLLFASIVNFIETKKILEDNTYISNLHQKIYSPENQVDGIPEDFRIKYEIPESRQESYEYLDILKNKQINLGKVNYKNFKEALTVFYNWLKENIDSPETLKDFVLFLNRKTYMVVISTQEIDTAINIFNVINSRGMPLTNADLIKSYIYGSLADNVKTDFVKEWERLETEFSEERYGQTEFDAILNFIRSYYNPQKPQEALYKEYQKLIHDKKINVNNFRDTLSQVANLYEGLIKDFDVIKKLFKNNGNKGTELKNILIIMREFYPSIDWVGAVIWFYKLKGGNKLYEFIKALEKKLYLDWLTGKSPTERLKPVYEVLRALGSNKDIDIDEIINVLTENLPRREDVEYNLDDESFYSRFRGRLAKYTLLRVEYHNHIRDILDNVENITIEHIFPQKPDEGWINHFGNDWEKYVNKLGNLTLVEGSLNSRMKNKPFEEKKKSMEEKGREFHFLNRELQNYTEWTVEKLEERHRKLKEKILEIYFSEEIQ